MFGKDVNSCGLIVDKYGIRFDPRRLDVLTSINRPELGSDIQQFVCAANWVRSSIPNYSSVVPPLHNLLEGCYKKSGKRTRKSVARIPIAGL